MLQNTGSGDGGGTAENTLSPENEQAIIDQVAATRGPAIEYESEEAALAAAERREQERLEEEAASAAGASPSQQEQNTTPYPSGPKRYSSVSGTRGDIVTELELHEVGYQGTFDTAWLFGICWYEQNDRPCKIRVRGLRPYAGGGTYKIWEKFYSEGRSCDPIFGNSDGKVLVQIRGDWQDLQGDPVNEFVGEPSAIGSIQVCHNDRDNRRMKGIRITASKISFDGSIIHENNADATELANCRRWAPVVLCPGETRATGLVVHLTEASGENEQIVGLQLICREVSITR